nr:hypothetical protein [Tanacetum cinerariifolium]
MIQSGSRDSGLSSSGTGFNQSGLVLILGSYAVLMSSESKIFISSGIGTTLKHPLVKNFFHISFGQFSEVISKGSL